MNRREFIILTFACAVRLSASRIVGQQKTIEPDLAKLAEGEGLKVFVNRNVSSFNEGGKKGIRLSENPGEGVAYIPGVEFANGTIEFHVKGKDVSNRASSVLRFTALMERPTTRFTFVRSISRLKTR